MFYKIRNNLVEISCVDLKAVNRLSRNTHSGAYIPMSCSRDYRKYSFYPRTVIDWNALPEHVALSESITSFKNNLAN